MPDGDKRREKRRDKMKRRQSVTLTSEISTQGLYVVCSSGVLGEMAKVKIDRDEIKIEQASKPANYITFVITLKKVKVEQPVCVIDHEENYESKSERSFCFVNISILICPRRKNGGESDVSGMRKGNNQANQIQKNVYCSKTYEPSSWPLSVCPSV